ncbi:MAG TPA: chloride channel protein, partial [Candidatus Limnocylindrales bacterium]|nr:chloride channel protein [Candidatus Limnocylindrales bacterium]
MRQAHDGSPKDHGHPGGLLARLRHTVRHAGYLRKWVVLGAVIGVVGGSGAIVFYRALQLATGFFLGLLAGWPPPTPAGEGGSPIVAVARPLLLPLIVAAGGLISGFIVFRLAPEAEGHGTDTAIAAFHHAPRGIRARVPLVKLVASAITIGSGGSGGREGPTAQISAGFGSLLARALDLEPRDARIAVAAGIAAGIGAIFRAPLGGAVLGAEIMYRDDVESDALVPSFIASIIAYSIFAATVGFQPMFGEQARFAFDQPLQLAWYALLGVAAGTVGILYVDGFYGLTERFAGWRSTAGRAVPRAIKPAVGGLLVGCIGLVLPGVLGTGYGYVQAGLDRSALLALPLWVVLALPFAKILATSLSIGSGGSGGIFGPGMVIGGLLGAGLWRLLAPIAPGIPADPAPFVIVTMMALFGSVAHAPLAVMLMVAEMTGNLGMLAPAMVAVGLATFVVGERTIYRSQLGSRVESPAHRFRIALPLLAAITAGDAARPPRVVLRPTERVADARTRLADQDLPGAPVVEGDGTVRGALTLADLDGPSPGTTVAAVAREWPSVPAADGLDDALAALSAGRASWLSVVQDGRLVGILSVRDIVAAYRRALAGNIRQVRGLASG